MTIIKNETQLLNSGAQGEVAAKAAGHAVSFTRISIGDANGVLPPFDLERTALDKHVTDGEILVHAVDPNNAAQRKLTLRIGPDANYDARELLLYASSNGVEFPHSYIRLGSAYPVRTAQNDGVQITIEAYFKVSSETNFDIIVTPGLDFIVRTEFNAHNHDVDYLAKSKQSEIDTAQATADSKWSFSLASLVNYGAVKLSSAINSTSEVLATTPKAVKLTHDKATLALSTANSKLDAGSTAVNSDRLSGQLASYFENIPARLGYTPIPKTGATDLTGNFTTTGMFSAYGVQAGKGSGSVALTINDGYGNANVTFNHYQGIPDQNGNAARIEVNTDADSAASAYMSFELKSNVTANQALPLTVAMTLSESDLVTYVHIRLQDNKKQYFGTGNDVEQYFNGTDFLTNVTAGKHIRKAQGTSYEFINGGLQGYWFDGGLLLADNKDLRLGSGSELRLCHDGSNSNINNYTGALSISSRDTGGDVHINATTNADVIERVISAHGTSSYTYAALCCNGLTTFRTLSDGVRIHKGTDATKYINMSLNGDGDGFITLDGGGNNEHLYLDNRNNGAGVFIRADDTAGATKTGLTVISSGTNVLGQIRYNSSTKAQARQDGLDIIGDIFDDGVNINKIYAKANVPNDFWTDSSSIHDLGGVGWIGTNGSYKLSLGWNGYRNSSGEYSYMGLNGNFTTAAAFEFDDSGFSYRSGTAENTALPIKVSFNSATGKLHIGSGEAYTTNNKPSLNDLGTAASLKARTAYTYRNAPSITIKGSLDAGFNDTKIKTYSNAATYTLDGSTFADGDEVEISRLYDSTGVLTIVTDSGNFYFDNGNRGNTLTMSNQPHKVILTKFGVNWLVEIIKTGAA